MRRPSPATAASGRDWPVPDETDAVPGAPAESGSPRTARGRALIVFALLERVEP